MRYREEAFTFDCRSDSLVGVLAMPEQPAGGTGVLVVVGGPQYRVGSHRQFVELSRALAVAGIPCLRFDYRGMGDSEGEARDFADVNEDIAAAVDTFLKRCSGLSDVVLWGLCDGATAAAFYAAGDSRIKGLVMLNPWVHTERAEAQVYLKHYYLRRITSAAFWRKIVAGEIFFRRALSDATSLIRKAFHGKAATRSAEINEEPLLPERLAASLQARPQKRLVILSQNDYVAREFRVLTENDAGWQTILSDATVEIMQETDHTFSSPGSSAAVASLTASWVRDILGQN